MTRSGTIFQLAISRTDPPQNLRLRNVEWGVLFAIDGTRPSAEILRRLNLPEDRGIEILEDLLDKNLIRERELTHAEYLAAQARAATAAGGEGTADEPQTLAEFLFGGTLFQSLAQPPAAPQPPAPPAVPVSSQPAPAASPQITRNASRDTPAIRTRPINFQPLKPVPQPQLQPKPSVPTIPRSSSIPNFRPSSSAPSSPPPPNPAPSAMTASPISNSRQLSLKTLIQFILNRAPDLNAGQLDVYRVFIRINTHLLKRNGIHSLRFTDDRVISDPELLEAIITSVHRTLDTKVPDNVFI